MKAQTSWLGRQYIVWAGAGDVLCRRPAAGGTDGAKTQRGSQDASDLPVRGRDQLSCPTSTPDLGDGMVAMGKGWPAFSRSCCGG